jgi:histidine triad (HIT) family protein
MYSHQPKEYDCPFCKLINGSNNQISKQEDIVYQDQYTLAFVSPKWWVNNPGNVIVIPKQHTENIYDISDEQISVVYKTAKKVALAIRVSYPSEGISTRQHNEPVGNQDVWHFHVHVFPRYKDDNLYQNHNNKEWVTEEKRAVYAEKLKKYFAGINN